MRLALNSAAAGTTRAHEREVAAREEREGREAATSSCERNECVARNRRTRRRFMSSEPPRESVCVRVPPREGGVYAAELVVFFVCIDLFVIC